MSIRINTPLFITFAFCTMIFPSTSPAQSEPYALGADISWVHQRENTGTRYAHNGQVQDMLDILKDHKFNYIRLRLFANPAAIDPGVPNDASGWNPFPYSAAGYCGLDSTIKYAKKVKGAGFKFLLDFHYSDTWADPGKQYKPMAWRSLNFAQLTEKVYEYTKESVQKFKDAGALPDMVQVGNEVVSGMMWEDGRNSGTNGWRNFATLVNAGIKGVKEVDTNILIMMHTINERGPDGWVNNLRTNLNNVESGAANKVDVIGLSYYPRWHGGRDSLTRVLNRIANSTAHSYKIAVVEYADYHREVNDIVWALPESRRFGTFVWEPQEFDGDDSKPLFDWRNGRRETNSRIAAYPQMAEDYGIKEGGSTGIDKKQPGTNHKKSTVNFSVNRNGTIYYRSDIPGTATLYTIQGRVAGRFDMRTPGRYDPAKLLQPAIRPGMYIISVESAGNTHFAATAVTGGQ